MGADRVGILGRDRGGRLLGGTHTNSTGTHRRLVGNGLQLILSIIRHFRGHNRDVSSLFRINIVKLVGTVSGFGLSLSIHFSACTMPVYVNRVEHCLESSGPMEIDHSVHSATCGTVRIGRRLVGTGNGRPAVRRVTRGLRVGGDSIILTLRTVISPISLCRPMCGSNNSAVCVVSRINSGSASGS